MSLKIKIRLRMLRDSFRSFLGSKLAKDIISTLGVLLISLVITGVILLFYFAGYMDGVNSMKNRHQTDIPMCASKKTEVRENPTGYILSKINRGDVVWVVQLQVPFAVVWYSDGHNWYLGTTTASYLTPCEMLLRDST